MNRITKKKLKKRGMDADMFLQDKNIEKNTFKYTFASDKDDINEFKKYVFENSSLDEDTLSGLPAVMQNANGTKVLVGPENVAEELKDTSVVMTKFDIGDGLQGMIGVVGPTRMDYAKVTARLSYFAESLSKMFNKPEQPQLPESTKE